MFVDQKERLMITSVPPGNTHNPRKLRWIQVKPSKVKPLERICPCVWAKERERQGCVPKHVLFCLMASHSPEQSFPRQSCAPEIPLHSMGIPCPLHLFLSYGGHQRGQHWDHPRALVGSHKVGSLLEGWVR